MYSDIFFSEKVTFNIQASMHSFDELDTEVAIELLYDAKHELKRIIRQMERIK